MRPSSRRILNRFDKACQDWGWESDQGVHRVEASRVEYERAKRSIERLIERLESART